MLVTVMVAVVTATMTTGHNDDSEPLFPTERFRKRMSRATKKNHSRQTPRCTLVKTGLRQLTRQSRCHWLPLGLLLRSTTPEAGTPESASSWHARGSVSSNRLLRAPPSWCVARRLRRRRLCFARRLRRRARNVAWVDGLHASRLRRITRGRPRGCHRISRRPG